MLFLYNRAKARKKGNTSNMIREKLIREPNINALPKRHKRDSLAFNARRREPIMQSLKGHRIFFGLS